MHAPTVPGRGETVPSHWIRRRAPLVLGCVGVLALAGGCGFGDGGPDGRDVPATACVDHSDDPAGCQPSTFDTPIGEMPSVRVNAEGELDPFSSEEEARLGFAALEERLRLFRNFEHIHWILTVPSGKDPATGAWSGGDLDGAGDARGLGIAGECLYVGHRNGPGTTHAINIFRIQPDPEADPPVQVGEIPPKVVGNEGFDDRELRSILYTTSGGREIQILVRNAGTGTEGLLESYEIDPGSCLPATRSEPYDFGGPTHEFFLWHDPVNPNRILAFVSMFNGGGLPDPNAPGLRIPDAIVLAVTDEDTGELRPRPQFVAGFSLRDVGGPPINEVPDATGLFADGRFADFSDLENRSGRPGNFQARQNNMLHSLSVSNDGERVYVAGGNAGFYVLDSSGVARNRDADLAAGTADCRNRSTVAWEGRSAGCVAAPGDPGRLPPPGDQRRSGTRGVPRVGRPGRREGHPLPRPPDPVQAGRPSPLQLRCHRDPQRGLHPGPARPSPGQYGRSARLCLADRRELGMSAHARPHRLGRVRDHAGARRRLRHSGQPDRRLPLAGQHGAERRAPAQRSPAEPQPHRLPEPRLQLLVCGHGLRAIDISNPYTPREVGHALTLPHGVTRSYPVFKDGLIYWTDSDTGLHVARYTGPRSGELPGPGSGTYEGNATSPHR